ncbi:MAG TPA: Ig-like domain-containing protein, partial [Anaerolineales bacterium]|nr:Ig-like domain-containing protein [Anaerolineales bacterium]
PFKSPVMVTSNPWGSLAVSSRVSSPLGFDVTITGDLNGEQFTCGNSCDLSLLEGTGIVNYTVTSTSGRTASSSSTWQRDGTPPDLAIVLPPVDGRNGWYVSGAELSATATDAISGLTILNGSLDGGTTWISFPIHFTDGEHLALIHARDVAGNQVIVSRSIQVDTVAPVVQITSHTNGDVVQGDVQLSGSLEDLTSGPEGGEISIDGGVTWQPVLLESGYWSFNWQSGEVPNGEYTIQVRGMDRASNDSAVTTISLTVDNAPPVVSITERWWIWENGTLKVSPNHFPIATIQVTIRDPQKRWKEVVLNFNPGRNSYLVKWDRRFVDGTLAPAGEYPVLAEACDVNGLCGQDAGRIVIPEVATSTATLTPFPTATSTLTPSVTPIATQISPTPTFALNTPIPEETPEPTQSSLPLWQIIGLLGLFMVIASASLVDPRPKALKRLGETFRMMSERSKDESINNK